MRTLDQQTSCLVSKMAKIKNFQTFDSVQNLQKLKIFFKIVSFEVSKIMQEVWWEIVYFALLTFLCTRKFSKEMSGCNVSMFLMGVVPRGVLSFPVLSSCNGG